MARILGIDYGLKRVGIAVTDPMQIICTPLDVIAAEDLVNWLKKYLIQEDVEALVIGMPLRLSGEDTHITSDVKKIIERLKSEFTNLKIDFIDERLTSKMARQSLIDSGVPKQKRKKKGALDSVSASLILQTYMEKIK